MDELWMRSVATVYEGKIEDFKRLAEEMLDTIRDKDSETLNFAIFLDEPMRVAVFLEEYASSAGWLAHRANFGPLLPRVPEVCEFTQVETYGDPTPQACAALAEAGPVMSYYPALAAFSAVSGEPAARAQMSPEEVVRKFFDCYTNGRPEDFDEVVAPDYVDYGQTPPGRGPGGARDNYEYAVKQAGAVIRYTIDALVADGVNPAEAHARPGAGCSRNPKSTPSGSATSSARSRACSAAPGSPRPHGLIIARPNEQAPAK
jgi:quinol monooxygenase YgiN